MVDTWVQSSTPNKSRHTAAYLHVGANRRTFIRLPLPTLPAGATIVSATLRLRARGASSGSRTLTVERTSSGWKPRRVTWNNQPGVTGAAVTASIGALTDKAVVDIDVTDHVALWASGTPNRGWRLTSSSGSRHHFYSDNTTLKPTLIVNYTTKPDTPDPSSPVNGVISVSHPTLAFTSSAQPSEVRYYIDADASTSSPDFDTGWLTSTSRSLDLASTAYTGLALDATTQWAVQYRDASGKTSDLSDWSTITRTEKGTVTIIAPSAAPDNYVEDTSPPIMWSFSETQTAFQVLLRADGATVYDSGKMVGDDTLWTIPEGKITDPSKTYTVIVRVWDDIYRVASTGDPTYASASRDFTVQTSSSVTAPTAFSGDAPTDAPWVTFTWSRATLPDGWELRRDGLVVARPEPEDTLVSGSSHAWTYYGAEPGKTHTYTMHAVVNGVTSNASGSVTAKTNPVGIWLIEPDTDLTLLLMGDDGGSWQYAEEASVYNPINSDRVVRVVSGLGGYEGSLSGVLTAIGDQSYAEAEAAFYAIKERPSLVYRLVAGDVNIPVYVGNLNLIPLPITRESQRVKDASFEFWQAGELPFVATL